MNTIPIIDVNATVVPLDRTIAHPMRALAVKRGRGAEEIFKPAVDPEMRGRRPSGVVFRASDVPKEAKGVPIMEEPDVKVPKRSAKAVAEELTGMPVQCREQNGYCFIEVVWPMGRLEFHGRTWFLALASLKSHVDSMRGNFAH